jgi:hypothetical protein
MLAYIAMKLIEESNDYRHGDLTSEKLLHSCDMYMAMADPAKHENEDIQSITRLGLQQFDFDRKMRYSIARAIVIFRKLWPTCDPQGVDIFAKIKEISGLELEEALLMLTL